MHLSLLALSGLFCGNYLKEDLTIIKRSYSQKLTHVYKTTHYYKMHTPINRKSFRISLLLILLPIVLCLNCSKPAENKDSSASTQNLEKDAFPFSHDPARLLAQGPQTCAECHPGIVEEWQESHHAKANRPISVEKDSRAFTPTRRIEESGVTYELARNDDEFELRVLNETQEITTVYKLTGVIGYTPLRQYLAPLPGGRLQTISATYDVAQDRWVDVFEGEDRLPGEWGHWTGQGMNWNANCAYCHTTEYKKNFDFPSNSYHSTWTQQGIACAECHSGLEEHLQSARSGTESIIKPKPLDSGQIMDNCATCHSRRDQLTTDAFEIGDTYEDHFAVSLPDQPGLYFSDGQIRDEVFVHGSFSMSRMGHAGVTCLDCHNPHSNALILPTENNLLCMRCHETGLDEAPIIIPTEHSFHPANSTGNQCVECHMPKRTYMQVDPRADHGFLHPDPLLTKELGIPNACNSCHAEESVEWAIEKSNEWYGEKLTNHRQRKRARAIEGAHQYNREALEELFELLDTEDVPAWVATYTGLLTNYLPEARVSARLRQLLKHESPLVRERAISALGSLPNEQIRLTEALGDSLRSVRISAARTFNNTQKPIPEGDAKAQWQAYLEFNADRPQSLMIQAYEAAGKKDLGRAKLYLSRAINMDQANGAVYQQAAIILSTAGDLITAEKYLKTGWKKDPENPQFPYSLGLLAAETGKMDLTIGYLEEAVASAPDFYRAWYNLSLAYQQVNRTEDAAKAMQRARGPAANAP